MSHYGRVGNTQRDRIAIDVGANDGLYTDALLSITSKIVAVEPNPNYFK